MPIITAIGFNFHFLNTNREHKKIAAAVQSAVLISDITEVPVKDKRRIVTAADMIRPREAAFRPLNSSMIYSDF